MKKALAVILAMVIMIVCIPCFGCMAEEKVSETEIISELGQKLKITVNNASAKQGEKVSVDISVENNSGFAGLEFLIVYNDKVLELESADNKISGMKMFCGKERALWFGVDNYSSNGVIATLNFNISDTASAGKYEIKIEEVIALDKSFKNVECETVSGYVTVQSSGEVVKGDLNNDFVVTDDDAVYLLMHLYFPEDYPVSQDADYDNDGFLTDSDAVYLLMHLYFPEDYPI